MNRKEMKAYQRDALLGVPGAFLMLANAVRAGNKMKKFEVK